jgi:dethiobiotin synthetase
MISKNKVVVCGIGTNVGKTVVSAILRKAFDATYWKPVQAGDLDYSDTMKVEALSACTAPILSEKFRLNTPASPHYAAKIDGIQIETSNIVLPETTDNLLIEGAGGLMVPLNEDGLLYLDVIEQWALPVVLVSRHYLGSINHTLLSLEALKSRNIPVSALIFVGEENAATEQAILKRFPIKNVHRIPETDEVTPSFVAQEAQRIPFNLFAD